MAKKIDCYNCKYFDEHFGVLGEQVAFCMKAKEEVCNIFRTPPDWCPLKDAEGEEERIK